MERKISNNSVNRCSRNLPFNDISSGKEKKLISQKKLTKLPTIHYQVLPETHRVWDNLKPYDLQREIFWIRWERYWRKCLEIGRLESGFLAGLVASDLFEKCNNQFREVIWTGIYRDDGLLLFEGKKSFSEIKTWRDDFQSRVK